MRKGIILLIFLIMGMTAKAQTLGYWGNNLQNTAQYVDRTGSSIYENTYQPQYNGWNAQSLPYTTGYSNYTDRSIRRTLAERASYNTGYGYGNWWNDGRYSNTIWQGRGAAYYGNGYGWYGASLPYTTDYDNVADRSIRQTLIDRASYDDIYQRRTWDQRDSYYYDEDGARRYHNQSCCQYPAPQTVKVIIVMQKPRTRCCG